ncbi:pre-rRNA processing protein Mrd1 [Blastomyces dermatitidis ER-3]|uniref:Multiple RNA-binding domain-containing protein 1 n=4 Tax=Blastomyces TaxID=229219 RepID=A0A179V1T5_BLAGS|nr:multiple RNA-binding domain-containing protein 1 [Blastomyces gilchristii SLH14081]XP_045273883.1 pre-rRNA processing protein Mrd1 [Blastomyces dermatitidis ER-3]EEQ86304.1 pre-rRNA processing protein Mrd1 [Blastomyces dermatitidis ER-3]EGE83271.1 multiple RNA-binding domain-containing protein 1 [Blastomyces dermatitidis ATCC 18188]OAT13993.1 multiple RNA-binding domain-containing protein 1 [Blastomyces gilchristii SLH14081]
MEENTRVFVSGLPPTFSNDDLRKHFSTRYQVTDAHVIPKRRIGFVGFKTPTLAQDAANYFNKTYIRMSKIAVEMARPVDGDSPVSGKPNSRHATSANSTTLKRKHDQVEQKQDPKLQEYLAAMQPAMKSKTWADDGIVVITNGVSTDSAQIQPSSKTEEPNIKTKRLRPDHKPAFKKQQRERPNNVSEDNSIAEKARSIEPENEPEATSVEEAPKSDMDWLRSRTSRLLGLVEEDEDEGGPSTAQIREIEESEDSDYESTRRGNAQEASPPVQKEPPNPSDKNESFDANIGQLRETGRLFVRNLLYNASESDLESLFSPFGKIDEVHVAFDTRHSKSKGFAYVQYADPEAAIQAFKTLDGKVFQGRLLHILPASSKKTYKLDEYELSKLPLKKQQQIKRKQEAASSNFSWNSLYMNADAVMSSVSERLGISKSELLDPTSSDAAVKQAHAETHVIQETKAYFSSHGVNLDSFKKRERGNTAILVKNFSFGVKADDLRQLFEPFGQIKRLLMPPSGTIAIVEFVMADECQKAFKGLAYRKLGDSILFLERAPKDLFDENATATRVIAPPPKVISQTYSTSDIFKATETEEAESPLETSTLFVRNLNFSTTNARLTEVFQPLDGFLSARVKTKTDPKRPGETLSMGFGFVEFRSSAQARAALAAMQGYKLDQHELVIKASHKAVDAAEERRRQDNAKKLAMRGTKILIKNLPFQATKKDIRNLFSAYGKLRSVRVPQKFDGTARGFAFADFVSAREAENAMDALKNTHLLGRRLVLDFASEEAIDPEKEIQNIEKKMDAQVNLVNLKNLTGSGRKKFNVDAGEDEDE